MGMTYEIQDSGERKKYESGAQRDKTSGKGRFDLMPPAVLRALAIHFQKGAEKYKERNWEKGMPASRFFDSAVRHVFEFLDGLEDENHLISAIWNLCCLYETLWRIQIEKLPTELNDLPHKNTVPNPYEAKEVKKSG